MSKESSDFCAVPHYDELDPEDAAIKQRRIETYSTATLNIGLRLDKVTVLHKAFTSGLAAFDRVFQIAPQVRMPHGLRLIGPTGSGTTALARYFEESLPRSTLFDQGFGCLRIGIGTTPSAGHVVASLLRRCGYPFARRSEKRAHWQQDIAFELLRAKGTRLIVFDNAHRLVDAQEGRRFAHDSNPSAAAAAICDLMDQVEVGVVLSGRESLKQLPDLYPELAGRMPGCYALHDFVATEEWRGVVRGFIKHCTWFDLSRLDTEVLVKLLHLATGGNLRALKRLLTETVLVAVQAQAEVAQAEHMAEAFARVHGPASAARNPFV
jgi:hypothetical protein